MKENAIESNLRSEKGKEYIADLRAEIQSGRSTLFDRALLETIDEHPQMTIREAWEDTENYFASKNRVGPRSYPVRFDN